MAKQPRPRPGARVPPDALPPSTPDAQAEAPPPTVSLRALAPIPSRDLDGASRVRAGEVFHTSEKLARPLLGENRAERIAPAT